MAFDVTMNTGDKKTALSPSVLVVSTVPQCGKTVVISGLVRAFYANKKRVLGVKPLELDNEKHEEVTMVGLGLLGDLEGVLADRFEYCPDQELIDYRTGQVNGMSSLCLPHPLSMTKNHWHLLTETCQQLPYPSFIEGVGAVASPWGCVNGEWVNALTMAKLYGYSVLMVTPKSTQLMAQLLPALTYCQTEGVDVVGWVAVESSPLSVDDVSLWNEYSLAVYQQSTVPHLGTVPWISHPIPVGEPLGRVIEEAIDVLPLHYILNDGVGWHARGGVAVAETEERI